MRKEKTKKKLQDWIMSEEYSKLNRRSSTSRNMKPLKVWTCQRAENLKKKSSKIPKNSYAATMVSAARRQNIGGGGRGRGAPINKSRRRRRPQIVGGGGAAGARLDFPPPTYLNLKRFAKTKDIPLSCATNRIANMHLATYCRFMKFYWHAL